MTPIPQGWDQVRLDVVRKPDPKTGAVNYALQECEPGSSNGYLKRDELHIPEKKRCVIEFHIGFGDGVTFPPDAADAISVSRGDECPKGEGDEKDEIERAAVSPDGKVLTIVDKNKKKQNYTYALHFLPEGTESFDPRIINGGGSES